MPNVDDSRIGFDDAFEAVGGWDLDAVLEELRSTAGTYDHGWTERGSQLDRAGIERRLQEWNNPHRSRVQSSGGGGGSTSGSIQRGISGPIPTNVTSPNPLT